MGCRYQLHRTGIQSLRLGFGKFLEGVRDGTLSKHGFLPPNRWTIRKDYPKH